MKKLINYLPFHFLLATILGICIQFYGLIKIFSFKLTSISVLFLICLLLLFYLLKKKTLFTISSWFFFILIGIISVYITNSKNQKKHFTRLTKETSSIILKVDEVLKPSNKYTKYRASITQVDSLKSKGAILLNISKNNTPITLRESQKIYTKSIPKEINSSLNPDSFDYKAYLSKQGIEKQLFLKPDEYFIIETKSFSFISFLSSLRHKIQTSLKKHNFKKDEIDIINALILGQRQGISKELRNNYAKAGVIHILAISGLHIGLLLLILSKIFYPLEKIRKGRFIKSFLIIVILWLFALFTGLSASVVRATTMFTFITIGSTFQKIKIIEHSLITSMLFILLIKPMFLFDVGFQLSYLAIFGIIWVQPLLYKTWEPKYKLIDKVWQLVTVSIAAQVGIFPISLYYFHQFPGLFILSNIIIISLLGTILLGGFIIVTLAFLDILPNFIVTIYSFSIRLINTFVHWVSLQESFLFTKISISFMVTLTFYLLIIFSFQFILKRKPKQLIYFLTTIIFLQTVYLFESKQRNTKKEFIVFHKYNKSIIAKREGSSFSIYQNLDTFLLKNDRAINSYIITNKIINTNLYKPKQFYNFNKQHFLSIDSLGIYNLKGLKNVIIHLQNNPKINLERVIKELKPQQIIADGSNYNNLINIWKKTCKKEKTPFWHTAQNGAYVLKY